MRVYRGRQRSLGEGQTDEGGIVISFEMVNYLREFRQISPAALPVFLCLVLRSNENGWSWPTLDMLSADTGWSVDIVSETIGRLCRATINGKRLLLAHQPVLDDDTLAPFRYLCFPEADEDPAS